MTMFKIDDKFYSDTRVVELPDEALALYLKGASWSLHHHPEDGIIPKAAVAQLGYATEVAIDLVECGLWGYEDDETYQFSDWSNVYKE